MRAWVVARPGPIESDPLALVDRPRPEPGPHELRVRVLTCGVCRTDLHIAEGDLPARRPMVVPGHEVVGTVDAVGRASTRFAVGDRIGIAWLRHVCGRCRFCQKGAENLCLSPRFTGWDDDGGYAEFALVHEDYAYRLPASFDDEHAAPLLCAGIIGYRAFRRAGVGPGGKLGIYGFGGSAHMAAQVALSEDIEVHVVTRSSQARRLALDLGAHSALAVEEGPPVELDGAIVFAPSGRLVPAALEAVDRDGVVAIAGIHMSPLPSLDYAKHLFYERTLTTVTANTRRDGEEFLALAERIPISVTTTPFSFESAREALTALKEGAVAGAAVVHAP